MVLTPERIKPVASGSSRKAHGLAVGVVMKDIGYEAADLPEPVRLPRPRAKPVVSREGTLESPVGADALHFVSPKELGDVRDPAARLLAEGEPAHRAVRGVLAAAWWIEVLLLHAAMDAIRVHLGPQDEVTWPVAADGRFLEHERRLLPAAEGQDLRLHGRAVRG